MDILKQYPNPLKVVDIVLRNIYSGMIFFLLESDFWFLFAHGKKLKFVIKIAWKVHQTQHNTSMSISLCVPDKIFQFFSRSWISCLISCNLLVQLNCFRPMRSDFQGKKKQTIIWGILFCCFNLAKSNRNIILFW